MPGPVRFLPAARRLALVTAAAFLAVGPTPSAGAAATSTTRPPASAVPATPAPAALQWRSCPDRPSLRCATLRVPLDYRHPSGRSIAVAVVKVPARQPARRIGSLVVNPGGPGVSGITFARQAGAGLLGTRLLDRFDIVGFDPRGVGGSTPVRCADRGQLDAFLSADPDPDTAVERRTLAEVSRGLAEGCLARHDAATLSSVGTVTTARDLEQLRRALGDDGLSYLGFSYGSLLGLVYAELFPGRVRALALDGILDPAATLDDRTRKQAEGFERMLTEFLASCDRERCPFARNGSGRVGFDALLARLETRPLTVGRGAQARTVGTAEAITAVISALYNPRLGWPRLEDALAAAVDGDGDGLLRLFDSYVDRNADGTYLNTNDANLAVNCVDVAAPRDLQGFDDLAARAAAVSPHFGRAAAYYSLPCAYWPVPPVGLPTVRAAGAPPLLLIGNTGDPATPYSWAQRVAARVPSSVLVTNRASGHTAYIGGDRCVRNVVEDYLVGGQVPAKGKTCG